MKKVLPAIFAILIIAALAWYFTAGPGSQKSLTNSTTQTASTNTTTSTSPKSDDHSSASNPAIPAPGATSGSAENSDDEGLDDEDVKPATELYKNADEALQAIKAASKNYDDAVLEQFSDLGPNCSWCDSFYSSVHEMMFSTDTTQDEKSYYAEVLAISGRVDNVRALVDAIKNSAKPEDADIFSEALELSNGKDDVTSYLGSQLTGANDTLRESLVAALSNQSSRLAAETLYKHTLERADADGYYSQGIGLGEFIPDEEAMPYLQELMLKRDQYSHLATKSLLNAGADGLRTVLDTLENSKDPEFDKKMLKDAVDHVTFDEDVEALLKKRKESSKQPVVQEFIDQALQSFNAETSADADEEEPADDAAPPAHP